MKQALEKMFAQSEWAPGDFALTVKNEQVRFEEGVLLSSGDAPNAPVRLDGIEFLTDGYGAGPALLAAFAESPA
jgi:hypothetical protein